MSYRIVLPIRYKIKNKKVKKGYSERVVSWNWFQNIHFTQKAKIKKYFEDIVIEQLKDITPEKPIEKYRISAYLYYDDTRMDINNLYGNLIKFLEDGLIKVGLIEDDSIKYGIRYAIYVEEYDKENPRMEFTIEEI